MNYSDQVAQHYENIWQQLGRRCHLDGGPTHQLPDGLSVLEFGPTTRREVWTYATCGMSQVQTAGPIELHLLSPVRDGRHVESLTAIAHYHHNVCPLSLGDSVN